MRSRWDRRLVVVVAGPGFGKTALLVGAMARDVGGSGHRDVWLSCEPADEAADHLTAGLVGALGLTPGASLDGVMDAVWSHAPDEVCLVLDDVHEIPRRSEGAALLQRLLDDLPANAHLVLASRDAVPVRTARLAAAGQLVRISEGDLTLTPGELDAFAHARGVDPSLLASTGGWPALAELLASTG
jgi:ATP/maltotriose-dependent transcriptional regulator MalT